MAVHVPFTGQSGNQFWNYCIGCILAEKYDQTYIPPTPYWQTKSGSAVKYSSPSPFIAQPKTVYGRPVSGPEQRVHTQHLIDLGQFDRDRPIHASGYFQRYSLIQPYADKTRNDWLKIDLGVFDGRLATHNDAVYVHVRRTDYVGDNLNPDIQCIAHTIPEYLRCLEEFPSSLAVWIVTDDWSDPFIGELSRAIVGTGRRTMGESAPWDVDFGRLASAKYAVISQSTFAWWACWLGNVAEKVVCPIGRGSLWHRGTTTDGDYPRLFPGDEPYRWKWVNCD